MKQKLTVTVLLAALVLTLAPVSARADWVKTSGGTKYEKGGSYRNREDVRRQSLLL